MKCKTWMNGVRGFSIFFLLIMGLLLPVCLPPVVLASESAPDEEIVTERMAAMRLPFIVNQGQVADEVRFYARTLGGTLFVTHDGQLVYDLPHADGGGVALSERLVADSVGTIRGEQEAISRVHVFRGNDPARWRSNLPTYGQVSLGEIYPGISLTLRAYGHNVEKLFRVQPGADPGRIRLRMEGAVALRVNDPGELDVETTAGVVTFTAPLAYQEIDGTRRPVEVAYIVHEREYGFVVGDYDERATLVIDPLLAATFLGGGGFDGGNAVASDGSGHIIVVGETASSNFPATTGAYDQTYNSNTDAFVVRLGSDLSTLYAATFLGGGNQDYGEAVVLDGSGIIVTGRTNSSNFPTTTGAYDQTYNGSSGSSAPDAFVARLSSDLSTLWAATFLGGSNRDYGYAVALDGSGNIIVTGRTESSNFPVTTGAYDQTHNGDFDVFVASLDSDLSTLNAATFLGGSSTDYGWALALDASGTIIVTGETWSSNFPTTTGAYDQTYNLNTDAFVARLSSNLSTLHAATFLGGSNYDGGSGVALDGSGNIIVTGETYSSGFPTTAGAYDQSLNGGFDVFVASLSSNLGTLNAATFLGGSSTDYGHAVALDSSGTIIVTGETWSSNFPTTTGAYDQSYNGNVDAFVARLSSNLSTLHAATFLGGSNYDGGSGVALDGSGNIIVAGHTYSSDFPATLGAYDQTHNGDADAFVAKPSVPLLVPNTYLLWTR